MPLIMRIAGKTIHLYTQGEQAQLQERLNRYGFDIEKLKKELEKLKSKKSSKN